MNLRLAKKLEKVLLWGSYYDFKRRSPGVWLKVNKRLGRLKPVRGA